MEKLVRSLIQKGVLKTPRIVAAFRAVDRKDFVPKEMLCHAYDDNPIPIGEGQTISQPYTVAFMLELLDAREGQKILDIGAGSGWTTALLAHIVGEGGRVYGVEIIPSLSEQARKNIDPYHFIQSGRVEIILKNAEGGLSQKAPFDRIIAAASAESLPPAWKEQLRAGGKIVMPIRGSLRVFIKKETGAWEEREYPGFVFVPFITDN